MKAAIQANPSRVSRAKVAAVEEAAPPFHHPPVAVEEAEAADHTRQSTPVIIPTHH